MQDFLDVDDSFISNCFKGFQLNICQSDSQSFKTYNTTIPSSTKDFSYQHFLNKHMLSNNPCVIKGVTRNWNILSWTDKDKPNFKHLKSAYGDALVPVANCGEKFYNAQKKEDYALKQYLSYWETHIKNEYPNNDPCLYLKDWHFTRDFPEDNIYRVPEYFASDWLNEYYTARDDFNDDYRFVYMGPKGSWTPFHADVFSSFSWSVNLCGKKRWVLFPPGQETCLTDKLGNLVYDVESPDLQNTDEFPFYSKLSDSLEIIQNAGDAIFVPSGWHHQVWNLEDTISVNHNWVNGCNIDKMWKSLCRTLDSVKSEILDCRDMEAWEEHCQLMLRATYGLDLQGFYELLLYIVNTRTQHLTADTTLTVYGEWRFGRNHLLFDLFQARNILSQLVSITDFMKLNYFVENQHSIRSVINETEQILFKK